MTLPVLVGDGQSGRRFRGIGARRSVFVLHIVEAQSSFCAEVSRKPRDEGRRDRPCLLARRAGGVPVRETHVRLDVRGRKEEIVPFEKEVPGVGPHGVAQYLAAVTVGMPLTRSAVYIPRRAVILEVVLRELDPEIRPWRTENRRQEHPGKVGL